MMRPNANEVKLQVPEKTLAPAFQAYVIAAVDAFIEDIVGIPTTWVDGALQEGEPLKPEQKKEALRAILANEKGFLEAKQKLGTQPCWPSVENIHRILVHPCPQNLAEYGGYFAASFRKARTIKRNGKHIRQVAFVYDHEKLGKMVNEPEKVPREDGRPLGDLRLKNGRILARDDIESYNPASGSAVALHAFEDQGILGLSVKEDENHRVTADQVHHFLRSLVDDKLREIDQELEEAKAAERCESLADILKQEYRSLTSTEKPLFLQKLLALPPAQRLIALNQHQYFPGTENALVCVGLLEKDIPKYQRVIDASSVLPLLARIKKIENGVARSRFDEIPKEEQSQYVLALSKRRPRQQIAILNTPNPLQGVNAIITYFGSKNNLLTLPEQQLLKCAEAVSAAPRNLYDKSFHELKQTEKEQFVYLLTHEKDKLDCLRKLNQQNEKNKNNLKLIQTEMKDSPEGEVAKRLAQLVSETTRLHRASFAELKYDKDHPYERLQFIQGLLSLSSAERNKLLAEQAVKNPKNVELIEQGLYHYKNASAIHFTETIPENLDCAYNGMYVCVIDRSRLGIQFLYFNQRGIASHLHIKELRKFLETLQKLGAGTAELKPKPLPLDPFKVAQLIPVLASHKKNEDAENHYFASLPNYTQCMQELAKLRQVEANFKEEKHFQVYPQGLRTHYVTRLLGMPAEERKRILFQQYIKSPDNIQKIYAELLSPGALQEDFYQGFAGYSDLLQDVSKILEMDILLYKRNFSELTADEKRVFILGLLNLEDPAERVYVLNTQMMRESKNLEEIRGYICYEEKTQKNFGGSSEQFKDHRDLIRFYMGREVENYYSALDVEKEEKSSAYTQSEVSRFANSRAREFVAYQGGVSRHQWTGNPAMDGLKKRKELIGPSLALFSIQSEVRTAQRLEKSLLEPGFAMLSVPSGGGDQGYLLNNVTACNLNYNDYGHSDYSHAESQGKYTLFQIEYIIALLVANGVERNKAIKKNGPAGIKLILAWLDLNFEKNKFLVPLLSRFGSVPRLKRILESSIQSHETKENFEPFLSQVVVPTRKREMAKVREEIDDKNIEKTALSLLAYVMQHPQSLHPNKMSALLISYCQDPRKVTKLLTYLSQHKDFFLRDKESAFSEGLFAFSLLSQDNHLSAVCDRDLELVGEKLLQWRAAFALEINQTTIRPALQACNVLEEKEEVQPPLPFALKANTERDQSERVADIYMERAGDYLKTVKIGATAAEAGLCSVTGYRAEQQDRLVVGEVPLAHLLKTEELLSAVRNTISTLNSKYGTVKKLEEVGTTVAATVAWRTPAKRPTDLDALTVCCAQLGDSQAYAVIRDKTTKKVLRTVLLTRADHTRKNGLENERIQKSTNQITGVSGEAKRDNQFTKVGEEALGAGNGIQMTRGLGNSAYTKYGFSNEPEVVMETLSLEKNAEAFIVSFSDGAMQNSKGNEEAKEVQRRLTVLFAESKLLPSEAAFEMANQAMVKGSSDNMAIAVTTVTEEPVFSAVLDGNGGSEVVEAAAKHFSYELNRQVQAANHVANLPPAPVPTIALVGGGEAKPETKVTPPSPVLLQRRVESSTPNSQELKLLPQPQLAALLKQKEEQILAQAKELEHGRKFALEAKKATEAIMNENQRLKQDNQRLKQDNQALESQLLTLEIDVVEYRESLERLSTAQQDREKEITTLTKQLADARRLFETVSGQLKEKQSEVASEKALRQADTQQHIRQYTALQSQWNALSEETLRNRDVVASLRAALENREGEQRSLQKKFDTVVGALQKRIDGMQVEQGNSQQKNSTLQAELSSMQAEKSKAIKEIERLRSEHREELIELFDLRKKIADNTAEAKQTEEGLASQPREQQLQVVPPPKQYSSTEALLWARAAWQHPGKTALEKQELAVKVLDALLRFKLPEEKENERKATIEILIHDLNKLPDASTLRRAVAAEIFKRSNSEGENGLIIEPLFQSNHILVKWLATPTSFLGTSGTYIGMKLWGGPTSYAMLERARAFQRDRISTGFFPA